MKNPHPALNIIQSALGHYEPSGNPEDANIIIGHSFGTVADETGVNHALAEVILSHHDGRPVVVDRTLADAFPIGATRPDLVVEGQISDNIGRGIGSWGTLEKAHELMQREGLNLALQVAHRCHVGRVVMQAEQLGIASVVPPELPGQFDKASTQRWTRSKAMWIPREVIGSFVLRRQGKL